MCAIAGVFGADWRQLAVIGAMTGTQAHRGPNGAGYLMLGDAPRVDFERPPQPAPGDRITFGHRRLAVLDTSSAGAQPMSSPDGRIWIVYNGEIYNYLELRTELQETGVRFSTGTDTEVIIAAYQAWGEGCFERFNGMWALAIWDGHRRRLLLSRDRLGVKPLHYARYAGGLVFASEIKGVLAAEVTARRVNRQAVIDYLKWSVVNHNDDTFFDDIKSFPAGCYASLSAPEDEIVAHRYWSFDPSPSPRSAEPVAAAARLSELFRDAVRLRLRSDITVGSCLSGGLDSSAIVCQAAALQEDGSARINTFTAVSEEPRFDESRWANLVTDATGAVSHAVLPSSEAFLSELDALIWHQEEPFVSASIFAQWLIMREAAANDIHVLLDGQGADEVLCGYRKFVPFHLLELMRAGRVGRAALEVVGLLLHGDRGTWNWRTGARYLPRFFAGRAGDIAPLLHGDLRDAWRDRQLPLGLSGTIAQRQIADLKHFSLPSLLRYEDRNSMAFGVEGRVPFLDYRLVEWCVALPSALKLSGGRTKAILRTAMRGLVPQAIIDRRDKIGFSTAQERWMRGPMSPAIRGSFAAKDFALAGLVDQTALLAAYDGWLGGDAVLNHEHFFRLFLLSRWVRRMDVVV